MKEKKIHKLIVGFQSLLILLLAFLIGGMIMQIDKLQGTARVINYAGIVRGATQRAVKLEIAGQGNDELIDYLDEIIQGLRYESIKYELVQLKSEEYLQDLDIQLVAWQQLKKQIEQVRRLGFQETDIVEVSERYFQLADNTVSAAEDYSEDIAQSIRRYELSTAVSIGLLVCIMLWEMVEEGIIRRKNRLLEQKAFIDEHTGLPNKGRCEQFFETARQVQEPIACMVFDLNNLKKANDTLGHSVGDQLILNFARLLRNAIPAPHFVGRYGGDEFMAVIYNASRESVCGILDDLSKDVGQFNQLHHGNNGFIEISYAWGYALSEELPGCSFRVLFDKADRHMYENKMRSKEHRT